MSYAMFWSLFSNGVVGVRDRQVLLFSYSVVYWSDDGLSDELNPETVSRNE